MGKLYENDKRFEEALELTRRAQFAAQQVNASEALYRWHWQSGRIHASMGRIDMALVSYRHALRYLQAVREELSSCYANPESSYQKTASVVCAELVDLLLQRASQLKPGESQEPYLVEARDTLETLKVFELRDYFRDDCIDAARSVGKKLEAVSGRAAVVYPVFLPNRVELLVSFSGGLKRFTLPVGVDELNKEIRAFRRKLVKRTTGEYLPHAQKLYDWLIRPLEADLDAMKPETLVFVPAGQLRTVPMAALHDGSQFLISKYPIAITPGLSLTDPRPVQRDHARMLSLGLTEARQGFAGLPYVSDELSAINLLFAGRSLINAQFSLANMEKELKSEPFSIVHIATHGQFGGDVDSTFILAFDEKFSMERFGQYVGLFRFREDPLDLLTLSACETAAGDDRAALGLAGVAVRAGARSALATLWHVNDPAAFELIAEFYKQLQKPSVSRAGALQAAQLKLLGDMRYDHPSYWAPFLLINNWL
jgi:CHAT domain-containing protein